MHFISFGETLYAHIYHTFTNDICIDMIMLHICIFKMYLILPYILHISLFSKPSHFIHILKHVQHHLLTSAVQKNEVRTTTCKLEQD